MHKIKGGGEGNPKKTQNQLAEPEIYKQNSLLTSWNLLFLGSFLGKKDLTYRGLMSFWFNKTKLHITKSIETFQISQ